LEREDHSVLLDVLGHLVKLDLLVHQGNQVLAVFLDSKVSRVSTDHTAAKETKEKLDHVDLEVNLVLLGLTESLVLMVDQDL